MKVREFFRAISDAVVSFVNKLLEEKPTTGKTCESCYFFQGQCIAQHPEVCEENSHIFWLPKEDE